MIRLLHIPTARTCDVPNHWCNHRGWDLHNVIQKLQEEGFIYLEVDPNHPDKFDLLQFPPLIGVQPPINFLELEVLDDLL